MNTPESIKVIERFYLAINELIAMKRIRGKKTFAEKYGINRGNFSRVSAVPESDMFQVSWLTFIVQDFNVSPEWLLTGRGEMFKIPK